MSNEEYSISRLNDYNLNDVAKLHFAIYNEITSDGYFKNKYDTTYTGVENIGFIAYNKQMMPIAFYGVIPCFLLCGGQLVLAAQSADTMTHLDYRYKGLFVQLAELTFNLCRKEGINIVFGFPNQQSLPGFVYKLNWYKTETMDCFIIPVKTIPLEKASGKNSIFKKLYDGYVRRVLKKYGASKKEIFNSISIEGFDGVLRDDDNLQYRRYSETKVIYIDGAALWIKINNGLIIGDIKAVADSNFESVMHKLSKLAGKLGVGQIQFHASPGISLHKLFSKHYKAIPSFPVIFKDFGRNISTQKMKFTLADIDIF